MTNKFEQFNNHIEPRTVCDPPDHFCRLRSVQGGMLDNKPVSLFLFNEGGGLHEQNQAMVIQALAQGERQHQTQAVNDILDSCRTVTWREVGEDMKCNHCSGLVVPEEFYESGVWHKHVKCLMCGRYDHIHVRTVAVEVVPSIKPLHKYNHICVTCNGGYESIRKTTTKYCSRTCNEVAKYRRATA